MKRLSQIFVAFSLLINILSVNIFAFSDKIYSLEPDKILADFNELLDNANINIESDKNDFVYSEIDKRNNKELSLSEEFVDNEILVSLTHEESSLNKSYTLSDFNNINILKIDVVFPYRTELFNRVILRFKLKESSKSNVLNSIKILIEDYRIYDAQPNYIYEVKEAYTQANKDYESRADKYTYACCAKKYTDPNKNSTVKVGIVDSGIYDSSKISNKVIQYVDCTGENYKVGYTKPASYHGTQVANVIGRDQVLDMVSLDSCYQNVCTGTCPNVELYSLKVSEKDIGTDKVYAYTSSYCNAINYAIDKNIKILKY